MRNLTVEEITVVAGGNDSDTVAANAQTAKAICGDGNVKSVSTDGFVCKDDKRAE